MAEGQEGVRCHEKPLPTITGRTVEAVDRTHGLYRHIIQLAIPVHTVGSHSHSHTLSTLLYTTCVMCCIDLRHSLTSFTDWSAGAALHCGGRRCNAEVANLEPVAAASEEGGWAAAVHFDLSHTASLLSLPAV